MHIEIFEGFKNVNWYWHFKSRNGRIVSDAESFPTKSNALRAAKACVRAVIARHRTNLDYPVTFTVTERGRVTIVRWS